MTTLPGVRELVVLMAEIPARQKEKTVYMKIWDVRDAVWTAAASVKEARSALGTRKHD
jgi:hypothetical protein